MSASRIPNLGALRRPGERQVDGDRGLADAALARGDRHHVLDLVERLEVALDSMGLDIGLELHRERCLDAGCGNVL